MSGVSSPPQLSSKGLKNTLNTGNSPQERAQALARSQAQQVQAQAQLAPA